MGKLKLVPMPIQELQAGPLNQIANYPQRSSATSSVMPNREIAKKAYIRSGSSIAIGKRWVIPVKG